MNLWDRYAHSYDIVLERVFFYKELHEDIVQKVKGCERILDLGTGTGNLLANAENPHKFGIDDNDSMLRYASKKIERSTLSKQNMERLAFKKDTFDAVVCINALYTSERPRQVLGEVYRVLKKGGLLALSGPLPKPDLELLKRRALETISAEGIGAHIQVVEECARQILSDCIRNTFTAQQLEEILTREVGFGAIVESHQRHYLRQNYFVLAQK